MTMRNFFIASLVVFTTALSVSCFTLNLTPNLTQTSLSTSPKQEPNNVQVKLEDSLFKFLKDENNLVNDPEGAMLAIELLADLNPPSAVSMLLDLLLYTPVEKPHIFKTPAGTYVTVPPTFSCSQVYRKLPALKGLLRIGKSSLNTVFNYLEHPMDENTRQLYLERVLILVKTVEGKTGLERLRTKCDNELNLNVKQSLIEMIKQYETTLIPSSIRDMDKSLIGSAQRVYDLPHVR